MRLILFLVLIATSANAQSYTEPARGTDIRADLMDALRPNIEWDFGVQVEFVILDLRVSDDVAFASVKAQHPGGAAIDMSQTPAARRAEVVPEEGDGATAQALLQRSGRTWVAVHIGISSTDAWWYWDGYCPIWANVIPEVCNP